MEPTHASFFSGVGGLDLGLERAGWRTVSFSEIDPYANAVLAERWPAVPNLGDIVDVARADSGGRDEDGQLGADAQPRRGGPDAATRPGHRDRATGRPDVHASGGDPAPSWVGATLWSGGFPCQDLSVAGKRAGLAGERSGLAYAFLDLVERHRPPAILLENVPGLLSSHRGKDFGALLGRLGQLGYWWAYRVLDAQHFGVPQRRRRVFIVALHAERGFGPDSAAEVLSVGTRCPRHPATGHATGEGTASSTVGSLDTALDHHGAGWPDQSVRSGHLIGKTSDASRMREADGLAGGLDGSDDLARPLLSNPKGGQRTTDLNVPLVAFRKSARVNADPTSPETWVDDGLANTLNDFDTGDIRTTHIVLGGATADRDLLPLGLDSHRYRYCGNGVVSDVAEWIGWRLLQAIERAA